MSKRSSSAYEPMSVACGSCIGCRLERSRVWAMRIVHEASLYDENCFLTLTYDPWQLPRGGSLCKEHYQKFMKRLRKRFCDRSIRYYHCGEYGDQLDRPHYHACLFNFNFPDKKLFHEDQGNFLFTSETLSDLWPYGFSTVGELTFQSAAYCARYVTKKITGLSADRHYERVDVVTGELFKVEPEYSTMSRRPGIGKGFYEKFREDMIPFDEVPIPGKGLFRKVPRFYTDQLEKTDPELFAKIKEDRLRFMREHSEEYTEGRLRQKYLVQKSKCDFLKRGYENET